MGSKEGTRATPLVLLVAFAVACDPPAPTPEAPDDSPPESSGALPADSPSPISQAPDSSSQSATLQHAAGRIIDFLQGRAALDTALLADPVTLYIAPEGGGAARVVPAAQLTDRSAWRAGGRSLVPPAGVDLLAMRAGRHFNCLETDLASRYPALAALPHVGVRLGPSGRQSCLQTWNMTLVFDGAAGSPRLIAAVYDQWEW